MTRNYYYLVYIQYLGYRYHGWQKQKDVKTLHLMIDKTLKFVLGHENFKTLGASRTDMMVSVNQGAFELFMDESIEPENLKQELNNNFPNDIRVLKIEEVDGSFNVINTPRTKEYIYLFSFGEKAHPFSAPFISTFKFQLDIELMKKGAEMFKGEHDFLKFCTKPSPNTKSHRNVLVSEIVENNIYTANFFPEKSYIFRIVSSGFMRNQIRLMMGQLIWLGSGKIDLYAFKELLTPNDREPLKYIAPAAGLILNKIEFDH